MAATTITSVTPISGGNTVFGNKRIVIADIVFDGGDWPAAGLALIGSRFGMQALDAVIVSGCAKLNYKWASDVINAYVSTTAGAAMTSASGIANDETIRVTAIGYGLK